MYLKIIGWENKEWFHLTQDTDELQALVKTIRNLQVP
jgi:hypothetical protein